MIKQGIGHCTKESDAYTEKICKILCAVQDSILSGSDLCGDHQSGGSCISTDFTITDKDFIYRGSVTDSWSTLPIGLALLVMYIIQTFCKYYVSYQGPYDGGTYGTGYAPEVI